MKVFVDMSIFVDCLRSNPVSSSKDFLERIEGKNNGFTSTIVRNVDHFNKVKGLKAVTPEDRGF